MKSMQALFLFFFLSTAANAAIASTSEFDHGIWDDLLQKHVHMIRNGHASKVDYHAFQQKHQKLKSYLSRLSAVQPSEFATWTQSVQLAFLINAYNAFTIELILTRYPELNSIKDLGSFLRSPWKKKFVPLLGKTRSLDDIEHGMIREKGIYNEPRIHFAVNCASIGCPALLNVAFTGDKLEQQLDHATRAFLADRSRNRYNAKTGKIEISKIFDWYRADFESGWHDWHSLNQFLAHYADSLADTPEAKKKLTTGEAKITFLDYDWKLNGTN